MSTINASEVLQLDTRDCDTAIQVLSAIPEVKSAYEKGKPFDELVKLADEHGGEPLRRVMLVLEGKYSTTRQAVLQSLVYVLSSPA